ncbi:MAG TPA: helix-hairpin-helix domain-containing protein [Erysipelothrix sp.]|nr:helix-hairpin-helix domain-containing protein [Erysipelothrix sp.]
MVQIAYHEKTHTLWVAPYSTLGEVLEQIELDESVDLDQINENLVLKHNDKFIVPLKTDTPCISINSADLETLTLLKGVGPSIAKRIVDYRAVHGLFQNVEEIMEVKGIGIKTFEKMQEQLCI